MKSGIYRIINIKNGHSYIGSAINLSQRKHRHFLNLEKNKHGNKYLQNDFVKYGQESFIFDVVEHCKKETLIEREQFFLDTYKFQEESLYNICPVAGSCLGVKHSDEAKRNMSLANKGKKLSAEHKRRISLANKGKKHSDEAKQKMSLARKGRKRSEETKQKISLAQKVYYSNGGINSFKGKKLSEEHRQKLSLAQKAYYSSGGINPLQGKKHSEETKQKMSLAHKAHYQNKKP